MALRAAAVSMAATPRSSSGTLQPAATPVDVTSGAGAVRRYLNDPATREIEEKSRPLRHIIQETNELVLYSSAEEIKKWAPKMAWELVTAWSKMPIFRVFLFQDRVAYLEGGVGRSYARHVFPEGEALTVAIQWWRKRIGHNGQGFALFEGGFDCSGPLHLTEAPQLRIDAATGEADGDADEEIERKRMLHRKRQAMDRKWAAKGMSDDLRAKIHAAEHVVSSRKLNGQRYMLKGGWVSNDLHETLDLTMHNTRVKAFECR
mmetsp:Transcript_41172/g.81243  ORF Transcript_41172/g.81243 Transcript_41172/m.81243 type:complete len:261 (-) Transcript_41172:81-863(-)